MNTATSVESGTLIDTLTETNTLITLIETTAHTLYRDRTADTADTADRITRVLADARAAISGIKLIVHETAGTNGWGNR